MAANILSLSSIWQSIPVILVAVSATVKVIRTNKVVGNYLLNCARLISVSFLAVLLVSYYVHGQGASAVRNMLLITSLIVLCITVPEVSNRVSARWFFLSTVLFGLVCSILVVIGYFYGGQNTENIFYYDFYLNITKCLGIASACLVGYIGSKDNGNTALVSLLLICMLVGVSFSLGRGALVYVFIFSVFVVVVRLVVRRKSRGRSSLFTTTAVLGLGLSLTSYLVIEFVPRTYSRLVLLIEGRPFDSTEMGRAQQWGRAINEIKSNPIIGTGAADTSSMTGYAHNMFLQVWADGGILAFALCILLVFVCVYIVTNNRHKILLNENFSAVLLFASMAVFIEYNKSFNFYVSRDLFAITFMFLTTVKKREWSRGVARTV